MIFAVMAFMFFIIAFHIGGPRHVVCDTQEYQKCEWNV
jgi:hypothetical protein